MIRLLLSALLILLPAPATSQAKLTGAEWIARCASNLAGEKGSAKTALAYCKCMHEMAEDNEPLTQSQMERMWPPAHRDCRRRAER